MVRTSFFYSWGDVGGFHTTYGHLKTSDFTKEVEELEPTTNDEVEPATNNEVVDEVDEVVEPETNDEVEPAEPTTLAADSAADSKAVLAAVVMVFGATLLL